MAFSVTHELRREWAFFLPADHFWGFFVAIYDHFSLATDRWSCPDLVDSEQILRREQLINLPGCLEPLLFEVLRAQITQR